MMLFGRSQKNGKNDQSAGEDQPAPAAPAVMRRALLVVDGSQPSQDAAQFAVGLAANLSCELLAAFVIDVAVMDYLMQMRIFVKEEREEFEEDLERKGRRVLIHVQDAGAKAGVEVETIMCKGRFHRASSNWSPNARSTRSSSAAGKTAPCKKTCPAWKDSSCLTRPTAPSSSSNANTNAKA